MNELINDECIVKAAQATPGLLTIHIRIFSNLDKQTLLFLAAQSSFSLVVWCLVSQSVALLVGRICDK